AFHAAALAAGGRDDGKPGPRHYHAAYYAAFVLDPDGHRIEAVCHAPEGPATESLARFVPPRGGSTRPCLGADHVGGLLADHDGRRIGVAADQRRHDRRIDHAQAFKPVDL